MADLKFRIYGETKPFKKALGSVARDVQGFKAKLGSIGGVAAGVFGGGAALLGVRSLASTLGSVVAEAREAGRVGRLTNAVLKSTGGVANVSAKQVSNLAEAISNKTGIDDEQIQSAQNLLLTFTKVRNEVGKGNDVFDQASQLAVDMSVALGSDAKSAALQLGKALNDPIKGVTALTRAGVSFTQQQKDQIKALVASGKVLEAQKLILAEVGVQFGGAAAAAADPMQKLSVTVANLKERVGVALLPIIEKLAGWLGENLPKAIDKLSGWFRELRDGFNWAKADGEGTGTALQNLGQKIYDLTEDIKELYKWVKDKLSSAFSGGKKILEDLADAFDTNTPTIVTALGAIAVALGAVAIAWNLGPGGIITGIALLTIGFMQLYNESENFRKEMKKSFDAVGKAWQALVGIWNIGFESVRTLFQRLSSLFRTVQAAGLTAFNALKGFGGALYDALAGPFTAVANVAKTAFNAIANAWNSTVGKISFEFPSWVPVLRGKRFDVPDIPTIAMAAGGIVTRPTVALIGEAGPEAVVPLSRAGRAANIGMGGGTINVQVAVTVDPITGRQVLRLVQDDQRKNGPWNIKLSPSAA